MAKNCEDSKKRSFSFFFQRICILASIPRAYSLLLMLKVVLPKQPRTLKVCRIKFPAELEERRSKLRRTATPPTRRAREYRKDPFPY